MHLKITVSGIVQGVGFRPFIYNLAKRHGLSGTVLNNQAGVLIRAEGKRESLEAFVRAIQAEAPPAARIENILTEEFPDSGLSDFRILPSDLEREGFTLVPSDLALCEDCRRELFDSSDRRFRYPLINCTNCGPRFSIIRALPYDRPATTMCEFEMCAGCRREYEDPADRRFHAQPVACHACGPAFSFLQSTGDGWQSVDGDPIGLTVTALREGEIVLLQGVGGFHLACDARCDSLVRKLRERKQRERKPFAVMFPDPEMLRRCCRISDKELSLLTSPKAPIVLAVKQPDCPVAESVAPGNPFLGAMLPYSPLHALILREFSGPLVMTSANLAEEPIIYRQEDALKRMPGIADACLMHKRKIEMFADDSVAKVTSGRPRVWRRARGYVPSPVSVSQPFRKQTLAFGPLMKNTFCLGRQQVALLSQHLGDMDSEAAGAAQHAALDHFLRLYDMQIELAACDLHPDYTTTRLAEEWTEQHNIPLVRVQHHHAHLAACLAENGETGPAIGLTLDGTGYGIDGTIWGGEVLVGDLKEFTRKASLEPVAIPGGEKAAREPWRMALAWLDKLYNNSLFDRDIALLSALRENPGEKALYTLLSPHLIEQTYPKTTSLGRLFDAVAAIVYFGTDSQFEGQAAMGLEWLISREPEEPYPTDVFRSSDRIKLSPLPLFEKLLSDIRAGVDPERISRRFHQAIVSGYSRVCEMIRDDTGISTVALSGGCFQNSFLLMNFESELQRRNFRILSHGTVPTGDGGISLGQAVIANTQEEVS